MRGMSKLSKGARRLAAGTMAAVIALFQTGMSAVKVMAADETGYEEAIVVVNEDNPYQITIMRNPDAGDTTHPWVPYIYRWYDPEMMYSGEQRFLSLGEALIKDYCANNGLTGDQIPSQGVWTLARSKPGPGGIDGVVLGISRDGEAAVYQPGTAIVTYTYDAAEIPLEIPLELSDAPEASPSVPEASASVPETTPGDASPDMMQSISWRIEVTESEEMLELAGEPEETAWEPDYQAYGSADETVRGGTTS